MSSFPGKIYGPYDKHEHRVNFPYVVYIIELENNETKCFFCLVAHEDKQEILTKIISNNNLSVLILDIYAKALNYFKNFHEIPCYVATLYEKKDEEFGVALSAHQTNKNNPLEITKEVMMGLSIIHHEVIEGKEYKIKQFASDIEDNFLEYRVTEENSGIARDILVRKELTEEIKEIISVRFNTEEQFDVQLYFDETLYYLQENNFDLAFYSFYYVIYFGNLLEVENILSLGMVLADGMLSAGEFDYTDWVSMKIADVARKNSVLDVCARAMRLAGVAASMMGRISDIEIYFNQAVNYLELISDSDISILVHMSYGLAIIEQFAHWEAESYHMSVQNNKERENFLKENLDTAKKIYKSPKK